MFTAGKITAYIYTPVSTLLYKHIHDKQLTTIHSIVYSTTAIYSGHIVSRGSRGLGRDPDMTVVFHTLGPAILSCN